MNNYSLEKKAAFFRTTAAESFFEAEELDTDTVVEKLSIDASVDAELDALLGA